jgi:uncharacterized protein
MKITLAGKPIGQIISISGLNVSIEIKQEYLDRSLEIEEIIKGNTKKFFIGTVGEIFMIGGPTTEDVIHYAIFDEIKLVSEIDSVTITTPKRKAIAIAKVIGYQDPKIKNKLKFERGVGHYPKFNSSCYLLTPEEKQEIFSITGKDGLVVGKVPGIQDEKVYINVEKFLGKHTVILGATGSGKSCSVASIIQKVLHSHKFSHVIFFDLHNEYSAAFPKETSEREGYKVNKVDAGSFYLPFWVLNFEELVNVFLGDIDFSRNNDGIRIFKEEIVKFKRKSHDLIKSSVGDIDRININSPLHFSLDDLLQELKNLNKRTLWKSDGSSTFDNTTGSYTINTGSSKVERKGFSEKDQAVQDPNYYDKLNGVIEKLESIKSDRRYQFLFPLGFADSKNIYSYLRELLTVPIEGRQNQITILDLSKIPSEVAPTIIGMIARICFEYKIWDVDPRKLPLYLIFEEAHNYIPRTSSSSTHLPLKFISRIAKEGRKYGISQLIISQRPSDLSELIVSQCSNFFVLRVTNPNDQAFIQNVLPDHLSALTNMIPFFQNGECLLAGEMVVIPTKVLIDEPNPAPNSHDIPFSANWKELLNDYDVVKAVHNWWEIKK